MKKKNLAKILICILIAASAICIYGYIKGTPDKEFAYCQEYVAGTGNIKGDVDIAFWKSLGEEFEIGANRDGYAVFKDPRAAMNKICRDYTKGIKAIQKEGAPKGFRYSYTAYIDYALGVAADTEAGRQANIVAGFVDIYMNSFPNNPS